MNTSQVNRALNGVKMFKGTFARDRLPLTKLRPVAYVVNTDRACDPGEHWVAIVLLTNGRGEYFDPFGLPPLHPELIKFLKRTCPKGWVYNRTTVQSPSSKSCGPFCILFIKSRAKKLTYQKFLNKFSNRLSKNETVLKNGVC